MKAEIKAEALREAYRAVAPYIPRTSPLMVLTCVYLRIAGDNVYTRASDTDVQADYARDVGARGNLEAVVPSERVRLLLDNAGESVTLELKNGALTARSGRSRYTINTLDPADFPAMKNGVNGPTVDYKVLAGLIRRVLFSAAERDIRFYLNGVHVQRRDGQLTAVATDGHRLAVCSEPDDGEPFSVILPRSFLVRASKAQYTHVTLLAGREGEEFNAAVFASDYASVRTQLIQGRYPDWRRVVPNEPKLHVTAKREALADAVRAVAPVASEKFRGVKLSMNGALTVSAASGGEDAAVELDATGDAVESGYNAQYIIELVEQATGESITLSMNDGQSAVVVRDGNWTGVVMPARL